MVRPPENAIALAMGVELDRTSLLVSKANVAGTLTYVSAAFCETHGGNADQFVGQPLSTTLHERMPRTIESMMWENIHCHREFLGVWINRRLSGEHFWTLGQVSPLVDRKTGGLTGLHHVQRWISVPAREEILSLYRELWKREAELETAPAAAMAGREHLKSVLSGSGDSYEEWLLRTLAYCGDL